MSKQINKNSSFLIRIDKGWWKMLSRLRTDYHRSFKGLVEHALTEAYTGVSERELDSALKGTSNDKK